MGERAARVLLVVLAAAGAFVFWHSGARAAALCERELFVSSGSLSLWPPGARCVYGEPTITDTLLNPWFFGTIVFVIPLAMVAGEFASRALRR